jgi:hypothetical protein
MILLAALLCLPACVAETVERRRPRKGPVAAVGFVDMGGGQVRYALDGWGWFVSGRRRHALRLMRKNCGSELAPQVMDEYSRQDADIAYAGEDITVNIKTGLDHFKISPFQHMSYECRPRGRALEAPRASTTSAKMILSVPPAQETPR